jgi:hypothetical protein
MARGKRSLGFSIELESKEHVKKLSLSDEGRERILVEGVLGELEELDVLEGTVFQLKGANGSLTLDLTEEEISRMLTKKKGSEGDDSNEG